jgi:hypothetical protein
MTKTPEPEQHDFIDYIDYIDVIYSTLNYLKIHRFKTSVINYDRNSSNNHHWIKTAEENVRFIQNTVFSNDTSITSTACANLHPVNVVTSFHVATAYNIKNRKDIKEQYSLSARLNNELVEKIRNASELHIFYNNKDLKFDNRLVWQAYRKPDDDYHVYFHFPETDTWIDVFVKTITEHTEVFIFYGAAAMAVITHDSYGYNFGGLEDFEGCDILARSNNISNKELLEKSSDDIEDEASEVVESFSEKQDDPFFEPDGSNNAPLSFISGSEEELERLIKLVCCASIPMQIWEKSGVAELNIAVRSSTDDGEPACIDFDNMDWNSDWPRIKELLPEEFMSNFGPMLDIILSNNTPSGHSWEYNDGAWVMSSKH